MGALGGNWMADWLIRTVLVAALVGASGFALGCGSDGGGECSAAIDCADGDACTNNTCDNGTCNSVQRTDIDDGDACTTDSCDPATGPTHTPVDIDDGIACTQDACDPATGDITNTPSTDLCSDGDGFSCTVPRCDPDDVDADAATGCVEEADASVCDDTLSCTSDVCNPADGSADSDGCVITTRDAMCDDSVGCTDDSCVVSGGDANGCVNAVNDGNCSATDSFSCTVPTCHPTNDCSEVATDSMCDDSVGCTDNSCVGAGGDAAGCAFTANDANCTEVDGFSCTVPTCNAATDCSEIPSDAACSDGADCTNDACVGAGGNAAGCTNNEDDTNCSAGQFCSAATDCGAVISGEQDGNIIITELRILGGTPGTNANEFIELHNTTASPINIAGFLLQNGAGSFADLRAVTDLDGASGTAISVPAGGKLYGIPNPAGGVVPPGVDFVYGVPGETFLLADTGDILAVYTSIGALEDVVDFQTFASDPGTAVQDGDFPGSATATTQLDPTALGAELNDDGNVWCTTFYSATVRSRVPDTAGAANGSCSTFVINEALVDFDHPTLGGGDGERVFIELAGPGGGHLTGLRLRGIDDDGTTVQSPSLTFGTGALAPARMPVNGLVVIADGNVNDGTTSVPNADVVLGSGDPQNGSGAASGEGIQLLTAAGAPIDSMAYGNVAGNLAGEGTPIAKVNLTDHAFSFSRNETSDDTDDNATDFTFDPTPTPGSQNLPIVPAIISLTPDDLVANITGTVRVVTMDFAGHSSVNGAPVTDDNADATFIGNTTTENCSAVDAADDGRGEVTWDCPVPSNSGTVERGDFIFTNPALLGSGAATLVDGWTYTGVQNETDTALEADFCNLQFPTTTAVTQGQNTVDIFGRIFEAGVTETAGANAGVLAELGIGPDPSDPRTNGTWVFSPSTFNVQVGNDDEYTATLVGPAVTVSTTFLYTYRFSLDGGLTFTYCDTDGAGSNGGLSFDAGSLGVLTVNP